MKKITFLGLCAGTLLAFIAGKGQAQLSNKVEAHPSRVLIAYYSWGGNTKFAAEQIQKATGGTLVEIKSAKEYPTEYRACTIEAKKDIQKGLKPELITKIDNIEQYDVIFIGSPNWWSTIAPPVASFASKYDFSGKTIALFVTHGGGGLAHCEQDLRKICTKATLLQSGVFSGNGIRSYKDAIKEWVGTTISIKQ